MTSLRERPGSAEEELVNAVASELDGISPLWHTKQRPDGTYVVFEVASPNERLFLALKRANESLPENHPSKDRNTLVPRSKKPSNTIEIPETRLLQRELSESLTVDRHTFGDNFLDRYIASVSNFEQNIVGKANYFVYGRRGSGKSSLLAFAMHTLRKGGMPSCWIAMQTYNGRADVQVIASVLAEVLREASKFAGPSAPFDSLAAVLEQHAEGDDPGLATKLERMLPRLRTLLGSIATTQAPLTIFLDDLHSIHEDVQPKLLASLYSVSRGNNIYIKASGIEQFTKPWDTVSRKGLESPHDAQVLKLDLNLTMPDRSQEHIRSILDAHAAYCGLPEVSYVAGDDVIARLVLAAAAVPRDALSLFSQAITKSSVKGQKAVSVTSVNAAASEAIEEKLKDVSKDLTRGSDELLASFLEKVKTFCTGIHRTNSFLVKIDNASAGFASIQKLIALRFVHVLHEGITPRTAGERYVALMLDYGFYIGIRAAKSVVLFPDVPRQMTAKELRKLPIFDPDA